MEYIGWSSRGNEQKAAVIIPDGCRDIIVVRQEGDIHDVFLSDIDWHPRIVHMQASRELTGYRMPPGTVVNPADLIDLRHGSRLTHADLMHVATTDEEMTALVALLAETQLPVARVATTAGVSERTLQRHFKARNLPKPEFWRQLGRARRAAMALEIYPSLSETALAFGYSDQAHMTREFVRWFGATPQRLRRKPDLLRLIAQPGLGNWTAEQSSTR
ncbi:AraC family transcriptional regulator [Rhizobium sp. L1K21]|uniref:helix-turn-helix domain-containing protein n=1 Tax=Rhizobium sp. L1K21 TaxID=2954933 RepID=UPI002093CAA8|nr:AraC family transcriptional regulator [Rhizobium sp. L1K21]MCO6188326.1 AraC family transcriptional regulator [Rhizobium sp. L1K21]